MTNIQPTTAHTIGNAISEGEAAIRERLAVLESDVKTDVSTVETWVKANWPHFVTWVSTAWALLKVYGKL
jgi:hypothetical protein